VDLRHLAVVTGSTRPLVKILVLDGFSPAARCRALAPERGHDVTIFHRRETNPGPHSDVEALPDDRAGEQNRSRGAGSMQ
jgi:hypothetical protein